MQKITFSCLILSLSAALAQANANEQTPKPTTVVIDAIDRTTTVLKQNPEALAKVDTIIEETSGDIKKTIEKIKTEIPAETLKATEQACKKDLKEAELAFKALFKHHAKKLEATVDATLGKENKEKIITEAKEYQARSDARVTKLETDPSIKKLEADFNEAHQATMLDVEALGAEEEAKVD